VRQPSKQLLDTRFLLFDLAGHHICRSEGTEKDPHARCVKVSSRTKLLSFVDLKVVYMKNVLESLPQTMGRGELGQRLLSAQDAVTKRVEAKKLKIANIFTAYRSRTGTLKTQTVNLYTAEICP
jgi:hypothetical protein